MTMTGLDEVISLILRKKPSLTREEVVEMVEKKVKELGELVDEYVAALLVAKELGVEVPRVDSGVKLSDLKVADLAPGLRNVAVTLRILKKERPVKFEKDGAERRRARVLVGDETGTINLVLWDDQVNCLDEMGIGDVVRIERGYTKKYRGRVELYVGRGGRIVPLEDEGGVPSLSELYEKHGVDCTIALISSVLIRGDFACVRGFDHRGRRIRIAVWNCRELGLREGRVYALCNVRKREELEDFVEYYADGTRLSYEEVGAEIAPRERKTYGVSEVLDVELRDASLRCFLLAFSPSAPLGIWVGDEESALRIRVGDGELASSLLELEPGTGVELEGVDLVRGSRGVFARLGRCGAFRALEERIPPSESAERVFVVQAEGPCRLVAAPIDLDLRAREIAEGRVAILVSMVVDDGSGRARVISSSTRVVEEIAGMGRDEILEYCRSGVLGKIVDYVKQSVLGRDCEIAGYCYRKGRREPLVVAEEVSPL